MLVEIQNVSMQRQESITHNYEPQSQAVDPIKFIRPIRLTNLPNALKARKTTERNHLKTLAFGSSLWKGRLTREDSPAKSLEGAGGLFL